MSTEDQNAIIVRLMRELTEAKKELSLSTEELRSSARQWSAFARALEAALGGEIAPARMAAGELLQRDSLTRVRALLDGIERLPGRIQQIRATLRDAGIDAG